MGRRVSSRMFLSGLALVGVLCASAGAQQVSTQQAGTQPALRGGLMGQRAVLPNVLGGNRSLPIDRRITLPGLSAPIVYQPATARVPAVVGRHYEGYSDGVHVDGRYDGDKFTLNFHLGQGSNLIDPRRVLYPAGHADAGYFVRNGRVYYNPSWYYYNSGAYLSTQPVDGVLTQRVDYTLRSPAAAQPQQPAPEPERELTAIERATLFMAADDLERAIEVFRDHLDEDPEDVGAMRTLGAALVEAGRTEDGVAVIAMAYRTDPMLARTALNLESLGLDSRRYDTLLSRVLQFAKRTDSGSGHLAGVMLLQADGKLTGASRVLDRAESAGLGREILDAFRRELGVPSHR